MCGRFVSQNQRRIEGDRARHGDPLLLPAAEITGTMGHSVLQTDTGQQLLGALARRAAPRDCPATLNGTRPTVLDRR